MNCSVVDKNMGGQRFVYQKKQKKYRKKLNARAQEKRAPGLGALLLPPP